MSFIRRLFSGSSVWYFSLVPINMALGSIKIVLTLVALSLGASLFDIGLIIAANAAATIVMSIVWGRLSDYFGLRIRFLLFLFIASAPMFVLLGLAGQVWELILLYTSLAIFTAGIQPIAAMYAVEYRKGKKWQGEIVKYNSFWNGGIIAGLVVNSLLTLVVPLSWVLYLASGFCLVSVVIMWKTAKEPELPLEREAYNIINIQEEEQTTSISILDRFDPRKLKLPKQLKHIKPVHLLFLACLIHWMGVYSYGVGEIPFMKAIGLSASLILSINVVENVATVVSFSSIVPRIKMEYQKLISATMASRATIILVWAGLTIFLAQRTDYAFIFVLILEVLFLTCYAIVWYPIMCFAISQAHFDKRGTTQGELLAVVSLANVLGSLIGGAVIGSFGYAIGFVVSAVIAVLAIPILRRINIEIKTD
jgi:MFS family permease